MKRNFLGGREPTSLSQANADVLVWCETTAGLRVHGTTQEQPLKRFEQTEQARLKPLPETPYDMAVGRRSHGIEIARSSSTKPTTPLRIHSSVSRCGRVVASNSCASTRWSINGLLPMKRPPNQESVRRILTIFHPRSSLDSHAHESDVLMLQDKSDQPPFS